MKLKDASPKCTVWLFKTIDREKIDGAWAVSTRYSGKDPYIDLTPFLGDTSSVRTSKSTRQPAGGFSISFSDKPQLDWASQTSPAGQQALESVYGLVEPMDVIEIRMWGGSGPRTGLLPIIMRGFVSEVIRSRSMANGVPVRTVTISGQDFGKIWQTYQVLYTPAYLEGTALLTAYQLFELFGLAVVNAMKASDFISTFITKIINPHLDGLMARTMGPTVPRQITVGDGLQVKHGQVNMSQQSMQGSLYEIMKTHGDVGVWNELYLEDRQDGVHCVYRPTPALHLTPPNGNWADRRIQEDAPLPVRVKILDNDIESISASRSDANVANFYWAENSRFDLVSEAVRKQFGLGAANATISLRDYPNAAVKYYGTRPMYASTQQGGDAVSNQTSGLDRQAQANRDTEQAGWIDYRRRIMLEANRDNVVLESGSARIKGGPMRDDGVEPMKAGDYMSVWDGLLVWDAYVHQIDHEFTPYQGYTTTLLFERGEGFSLRTSLGGDKSSPWIVEQASRADQS